MNQTTLTQDGAVLKLERVIDAPKHKVWAAYTTEDLFTQWWGPNGWSTRATHFDVSAGGYVLYGMKCEDPAQGEWFGQESWGKAVYESVVPEDEFTYTDYFCDENGEIAQGMPVSKTVLRMEEIDGKTKITSLSTYESEEAVTQVLAMGMEQGIKETMDRLEKLVV